jgi:hypothetical protein
MLSTLRPAVRVSFALVAASLLGACAQMEEVACATRVRDHFDTLEQSASAPETPAQARTLMHRIRATAASAPLEGCNSQVRLAVSEIVSASDEVDAAISNENLLVHAFFSLFDAGDSSPLSQDGNAAIQRLQGGFRMLDTATR